MSILSNFPLQENDQIEVIELFGRLMAIGKILRDPAQVLNCSVHYPAADTSESGSEESRPSDFQ